VQALREALLQKLSSEQIVAEIKKVDERLKEIRSAEASLNEDAKANLQIFYASKEAKAMKQVFDTIMIESAEVPDMLWLVLSPFTDPIRNVFPAISRSLVNTLMKKKRRLTIM
jgi:predicted nuclease with TOPRIM domain